MKSIRTDPSNHGSEGDERIRTAVCAPGADPVYEHRHDWTILRFRWDLTRYHDDVPILDWTCKTCGLIVASKHSPERGGAA